MNEIPMPRGMRNGPDLSEQALIARANNAQVDNLVAQTSNLKAQVGVTERQASLIEAQADNILTHEQLVRLELTKSMLDNGMDMSTPNLTRAHAWAEWIIDGLVPEEEKNHD